MSSKDNRVCNILVTNLETRVVYEHNRVPFHHVKMLEMSPNLKVEILKTMYDSGPNGRRFNEEHR